MSVPILEVVDLHAAYGRIEVLRGVDLRVPKGAVMALLGPNGGGKSTLVKDDPAVQAAYLGEAVESGADA